MGSTDDVVGLVSIGQLAKAAGVSSRTIRYYEELGILPEPQRTSGGTRKYPREYCGYIETALALKDLGFRLEEVKPLAAWPWAGRSHPASGLRPPIWWKTGSKRWTGRWPCCANCATACTIRPPPGPGRSTCAPWVTPSRPYARYEWPALPEQGRPERAWRPGWRLGSFCWC